MCLQFIHLYLYRIMVDFLKEKAEEFFIVHLERKTMN
jgi:hypothetical protein